MVPMSCFLSTGLWLHQLRRRAVEMELCYDVLINLANPPPNRRPSDGEGEVEEGWGSVATAGGWTQVVRGRGG